MNQPYLLDTNTVSCAASGRSPEAAAHISRRLPGSILISAISCAEIWFGLARRPDASKLARATQLLFAEVSLLDWTPSTANVYAKLRAEMERIGKPLGPVDMLIAAHALEVGATLVTNDRAFTQFPGLNVEDWTAA